MKNKLLVTTALVGFVASGAALAETKISGGMVLGYKSIDFGTANGGNDGFGRETQINVAKSGDLNNGLKYNSGFSLEFDGGSEGSSTSNENVYFDVISGNTTLSFGIDHLPNTSSSAAPRVAEHADTTFGSNGSVDNNSFDYHAGAGIKESFGIGVIQKTNMGTVFASFVPNQGDNGGDDQDVGAQNTAQSNKSAYNIGYRGDAGVKGLNVQLVYQKETVQTSATTQDGKVKQYGIGYNFGKFAAGVMVNDIDEKGINTDTKSVEFGVTAALNDKISVGINYVETEGNDTGVAWTADEEIMTVQVGYNMGPATLTLSHGKLENANGLSTAKDIDATALRLSTAF